MSKTFTQSAIKLKLLLLIAALTAVSAIAAFADSAISEPPAKVLQLSQVQQDHLLHDRFVVSRNVGSIPVSVKRQFASLSADRPFRMAEPGQMFRMTDDGQNAGLPSRRLIFVGRTKESCLLCYVRGGYSVNRKIASFRLTAGKAKLDWVGDTFSKIDSLAAVRKAVLERKSVYGGDNSL